MALSLDEALGMSLVDETDESIHVDVNTRQVTIPESQQVFGVESDEDVEVKHIVIDGRYNDGTDLSTFTFRINYQNANGDKGTYLATELKVNDDSIEFDWVIGRQVVAYKGTIAFIVCAYTIDSSSVIQNEWNSTLGKGTVLEGLEVSEFDFGDDIVRQLASILSDVNAAQASAKASADEAYKSKTEVVALGKEQQAAIEKKGKDTLATIPDDYTQVSNGVSQLKEDTAKLKDGKISKFYAPSQGDTTLPDSDSGRIMDLKLYGKSEQKQYSGKNLLLLKDNKVDSSPIAYEIKNGVVTFSGKLESGYSNIILTTFTAQSDGEYAISTNSDNPSSDSPRILFSINSGAYESALKGATKSLTAGDEVLIVARISDVGSYTGRKISPMIEKGSTATAYEPYVGGIPSPNPEYPQEIKSVVKPVMKVMGKNLLSKLELSTSTKLGITVSSAGQGKIAVKGTATGEAMLDFWGQNFLVPKGAKLLCKILQGSGSNKDKIYFYSSNYKGGLNTAFGEVSSISASSDYKCSMVRVLIPSGESVDCTLGLSLQMDTSTNYEPYAEQTAALPYTLNAIPVSSGGNVTIDGQQYIADYVDVERGKLVRMCKTVDFEEFATESFANVMTNSKEARFICSVMGIKAMPSTTPNYEAGFITSIRRLTQGLATWNQDIIGVWQCGQGSNGDVITIRIPVATTSAEYFKSIGGCKGVFQAATPTETDLTADEIAAFKALASHYPVTNVSTTSDQLDGYTVFNYPISLANGWNYVKQQLGDTRDYLYGIDLMTAEAYVNSEYAAALAEIEA